MPPSLIADIMAGHLDHELDAIIDAANARLRHKRQAEGITAFHALAVGDRVKVIGGQKYLRGALGTITAKRQSKVTIDLDTPRGRMHKGIVCPPELLEKVQG